MSISMDSKVNSVPRLRYADAATAVGWLCEAFDFERYRLVPGEVGAINHAQLDFGTCIDPEGSVWTFGSYDPNAENEEPA